MLVHAGDDASPAPHGLLKTAAADGYALEGAVLVERRGGAVAARRARPARGRAAESEALARSVDVDRRRRLRARADRSRLALVGRGRARAVAGITRGTTRAHLVRAALEAIAHQVADVVDALPQRAGASFAPTAARPPTAS